MPPRRELQEDKFSPSAMRQIGDPASGAFDTISPSGVPLGQVVVGSGAMSVKKAMDFVNAVKEGRIDPASDEGVRETLNLALMTLGRGAPTARPGGMAPSAPPRYNVNPSKDFRQAVDFDYGVKPRIPYDKKPIIDETFVPLGQARTVSEVTSKPSSLQRLGGESPMQDVRLGEAQTTKRNDLSWQNLMDEMRASGEGMPERVVKSDVSPVVQLAQAKVAGRTLTPAEVGGSTSPFLTRPTPGIKRPESSAAETALRMRETQMAPAEYPAVPSFLAQRQNIASQIAAEETRRAAEQQLLAQRERLAGAISEASAARPTGTGPMLQPSRGGPTIGAMGPLGAGAAVTALGLGSQGIQDERARQAGVDAVIERQKIDDLDAANSARDRAAPQQPFANVDFFAPSPAPEPFTNTDFFAPSPAGAASRYTDVPVGEMDPKFAATVAAAKRQVGAARPTGSKMPETIDLTSGASKAPSGGMLSSIFNRPATTRQLFQQSVDNPDDAGAWMRAERQYASTHKDKPSFDVTKLDESGMARGGAANASPTKEALLHKSLEIIHHMIRSR